MYRVVYSLIGVGLMFLMIQNLFANNIEERQSIIDIVDTSGICGDTVSLPILINNSNKMIKALGFKIKYDPESLLYVGYTKNRLADQFMYFDISNKSIGTIVVGAAGNDGFYTNTSETLAEIQFELKSTPDATKISIVDLTDDIRDWSTSGANIQSYTQEGVIDILSDIDTCQGSINIPIHIISSPESIKYFEFDIHYEPDILEYMRFQIGNIVEISGSIDVTQISNNIVRVEYSNSSDIIPNGFTGEVLSIQFETSNNCKLTKLSFDNFKGDLVQYKPLHGYFYPYDKKKCNGDIDRSGRVTSLDALKAFSKAMGKCPVINDELCKDVCCDVNNDNDCTAGDALCIFKYFMEQPSCLDKHYSYKE